MLTRFTLPEMAPQLTGGIGQGGEMDEFVRRFGASWRKTPFKGVYFIACDEGPEPVQITTKCFGGVWELAYYFLDSTAEFKRLFGKQGIDAIYKRVEPGFKYPAVQIIRDLKSQARW